MVVTGWHDAIEGEVCLAAADGAFPAEDLS